MTQATRRASHSRTAVVPEQLESRRLLAAVYDAGGFESPRFTTGPLEGQDVLGPWLQDTLRAGVAQVRSEVVESGQQAVRMIRPAVADGDTRYGVVKPVTPAGVLQLVRISWDMNVPQNTQGIDFGPFFGVEAYDASVTPLAPKLAGSLGVDATTGDVLYQDGTTGFLTESGFNVQFGVWNHYTLELNYDNDTYTIYVNGDDKATTGFVDDAVVAFTDAPLAALAATADSKATATGTAYFDNYVIEIEPLVPQSQTPPRVNQVYVSSSQWSPDFKSYLEEKGYGDDVYGFAIPDRDQLNELPWINLNQVSVRFSEQVQVDAGDLQIRGVNVPNYTLDPASFHYDAATRTATWQLAPGTFFDHDRILLDLDGDSPDGVKDSDGNFLDGEWRNPGGPAISAGDRYPSGDGTAGGDFRFRVNILAGDVDRNGVVVANDFSDVKKKFFSSTRQELSGLQKYDVFYDVDGSGQIVANDFSEVKKRFFNTLPQGEPTGTTYGSSSAAAGFSSAPIRPADEVID
jgi:hypothetical protein